MKRADYIYSLFENEYQLSNEKIKQQIPSSLFNELINIGYICRDFFKIEIIDFIPQNEIVEIDVYYQQKTTVCKLYQEIYSSDYERESWGYKYIIFEGITYQLLYGYSAS